MTDLLDPQKHPGSKLPPIGAPPQADTRPPIGVVARLYWMLAGKAVLYLAAVTITQQAPGRVWTADGEPQGSRGGVGVAHPRALL